MIRLKLLLVRPPRRDTSDVGLSVPPLGLAYIAAVARDGGHEGEIIDAYALNMSWTEFESQIRRRRPDVLGLSAMTPVADVAARAGARGVSPAHDANGHEADDASQLGA